MHAWNCRQIASVILYRLCNIISEAFKCTAQLDRTKSRWDKITFVHFFSFIILLSELRGIDKESRIFKNPTIFNIIRWVDGTIVSLTKYLMFQVLHILFSQFLTKFFVKILSIYLFFSNFKKIKIKSFEWCKSKPATHCCFIFNLSK